MRQKLIATAGLVAMAMVGMAQSTPFTNDGRPERLFNPVSGLATPDIKFLKMAQAGNEFEIEASQLAMTNGSSDFVKEFAKEMITDHQAAKNEVGQIATQKSLTVSSELPKPLQMKLNKLKTLHGAAFDLEYRADQKAAHEQTIHLFKSEIDNGHDEDVKAAAVKLLPTVEMHYKMLLSGKTEMGSTAATHGE